MNYWRMQLHPADPDQSAKHAAHSIEAGYIGLDFSVSRGDLTTADTTAMSRTEKRYLAFCNDVALGDIVLVMAHHYPFALVRVVGEYNYIREPKADLRVWFRHFRRVDVLGYYADYETNPANWESARMTDTFTVLIDEDSISYKLIKKWAKSLGI